MVQNSYTDEDNHCLTALTWMPEDKWKVDQSKTTWQKTVGKENRWPKTWRYRESAVQPYWSLCKNQVGEVK